MQKAKSLFLLLSCAVLAGPALAEMPKQSNGQWVDENGATLYTFDKDTKGKSACNAACAQNWPPALAGSADKASGDWSFVKTHDGKQQWAYKGQPRSEEHTSELQSLMRTSYAVFCLKKKNKNNT